MNLLVLTLNEYSVGILFFKTSRILFDQLLT